MSSPWHVDALERAVDGSVEHVGDAQPRLVVKRPLPKASRTSSGSRLRNMTIAGTPRGEGAHVASALHIVLAAQRVHADAPSRPILPVAMARLADRHHRGRTLAVLGDAEAVVESPVAAGGIEPSRAANGLGGHAARTWRSPRGCCAARQHERGPILELVPGRSARAQSLVDETFGNDHMRHGVEDGDVGPRLCRGRVVAGLDVRRAHQIDAPRIDDDQPWRPGAARFFMREANTGWPSVGLAPITT